jgi:transcriptional regulator with XRE-family HTH domain
MKLLVIKRGNMQYKPDRLAARRIYLGLTQQRLAELVGVPFQQISKYERGQSMPTAGSLVALADSLQCSVDYLLGRTDNPSLTFSDLDTMERDMVLTFRDKKAKFVETEINKQVNKIRNPTRDHIIRLVKFFLQNPGQVNDIPDDK